MLLIVLGLFAVLEFLIVSGVINPYVHTILCYAGIVVISALGLNLIYGYTGQFSLGHAAFYGIGGYTAALVTRSIAAKGLWVLPVGVLAGALTAGVIALLIGLPILRLKSDYLGIATLGFGMIVNVLFKNSDKLIKAMGGAAGMRGIERLTTFPWVFIFCLGAVIVLRNLVFSGVGRALISIREDELAAEAVGVNATSYKTLGFVIGCMFAGVAGGLYAHLYTYLNPDNFDFLKSIDVLLIVVIGGLGSISGTIIAGAGWAFLLEGLRVILPSAVQEWRMVVYPLVLIVVMLFRSGGIMGGSEFNFLKPQEYRRR
ncbi:MAG: branched-chain amino acid ABC transporter permease [candidate division WOR-3 bacterium]|nr:branched-chain amino acid ABC transporter permease [candidate division WOR-3 bacterium]